MEATKKRTPDITLSGRQQSGEERFLYLYEYKIDDTNVIFEYRFSDWDDDGSSIGYFELKYNSVYYNRDIPKNMDSEVYQHHRGHAYSNNEIRIAIENYLIEKMLLVETV
jgi:hypothetical protein